MFEEEEKIQLLHDDPDIDDLQELEEQYPFMYQKYTQRDTPKHLDSAKMFKTDYEDVQSKQLESDLENIEDLEVKRDLGLASDGQYPRPLSQSAKRELISQRSNEIEEMEPQQSSAHQQSQLYSVAGASANQSMLSQYSTYSKSRAVVGDRPFLDRDEFEYYRTLKQKKQIDQGGLFKMHGKKIFYSRTSLFLMTDKSLIRQSLVWLIDWKWFDRLILTTVMINSLSLAIFDYSDRDSQSEYNNALTIISGICTVIFFVEAIIKIMAMGFVFHGKAYLRDGWNIVDFIIVIAGILDFIATSINLKVLRIIRVIRPLRSIKVIPSMQRLVITLLHSLPELMNAAVFIVFIMILFAILGLQQFHGVIYYRCRVTDKPINATYWPKSQEFTNVCSPSGDGAFTCPNGLTCGSPSEYGISLKDDGVYTDALIDFGVNSFDNFGNSLLTVFQVLTLEHWTRLMYNITDGYTKAFSQAYFCLLVIAGHFYMLQLLLAVVMSNINKIQAQEAYNDINQQKQQVQLDDKEIEEEKIQSKQQSQKPSSSKVDEQFVNELKIGEIKIINDQLIRNNKYEEQAIDEELNTFEQNQQTEEQKQTQPFSFLKNVMIAKMSKQLDRKAMTQSEEVGQENPFQTQFDTNEDLISKDLLAVSANRKIDKDLEDSFKNNIIWNMGKNTPLASPKNMVKLSDKQKKAPISLFMSRKNKEFGIAILSKVIGVDQIEGTYKRDLKRIESTKLITDLNSRLILQHKIEDQIAKLHRKIELNVSKMYIMSRKNVYGIQNEINLVENIHRSFKTIFKERLEEKGEVTSKEIEELFKSYKQMNKARLIGILLDKPEIDLHTTVSLKVALNLKDMTMNRNVKSFFLSRFKRLLVEKSIVDSIHTQLQLYIHDTQSQVRGESSKIFQVLYLFGESLFFNTMQISAIVVNSFILALSSHPIDEDFEAKLDFYNLVFFGFFIFEMIIKLMGRGINHYFRDQFNWFDTAVILVTSVDIVLQNTLVYGSDRGAITILRFLRILRIMRFGNVWNEFSQLIDAIKNTIKDVSNLSVLLFIFIFTYSVLGLELFAYKVKRIDVKDFDQFANDRKTLANFNSIGEAFLSVFIVLANQGWSRIFHDHYRNGANQILTTIYFVSLVIVGQYILINLFVAALIENFEALSVRNYLSNKLNNLFQLSLKDRIIEYLCFWRYRGKYNTKIKPEDKIEELLNDDFQETLRLKDVENQLLPSLYIFTYDGRIRTFARYLTEHPNFEWAMILVIVLSTIQLAIDNPLNDPEASVQSAMIVIDYLVTAIFTMEALLKIINKGFGFCGSTSFIRSQANILDFTIILITICSYLVNATNLKAIKVFRLLKVLRPLRVISRNESLRVSLLALSVALPGILNIVVVSLLFYFMFGIISLNYFKGLMYSCGLDLVSNDQRFAFTKLDDKWDCLNIGGHWQNQFMNFDNISQSVISLFILSTSVDWSILMFQVTKVRGFDLEPADHIQSPFSAFFFVVVIIIGNFFLMNLFVGMIITTCNREKEHSGSGFILTEGQKQWVSKESMMIQAEPKFKMLLPHDDWRQPFFHVAENLLFQQFIMVCIVGNTIVLSLIWYGQSAEVSKYLELVNYIFAGIFTIEFATKLVGYGQRFFKDQWNTFDMIIVLLTIMGIIMSELTSFTIGAQTTVVRSLRMARIFYFFKRNRVLRTTFKTFFVSLPAIANIGSLMLLIILIYSILGVYLFAEVKLNGQLNSNANFQSVGAAFVTLIRIATGEEWPKIMEAASRQNSAIFSCIKNPTFIDYQRAENNTVGCGDYFYAMTYFFSYTLVIGIVFLKLFIAIVLQTFKEQTDKENKFMNTQLSDHFRDIWSEFDPDATGFIKTSQFSRFLVLLGEPLGWDKTFEHNFIKQQEYLCELDLPRYNSRSEYYFSDVYEQLILLMIIRRELINFAIKKNHLELLTSKSHQKIIKQKAQYQKRLMTMSQINQNRPNIPKLMIKEQQLENEGNNKQDQVSEEFNVGSFNKSAKHSTKNDQNAPWMTTDGTPHENNNEFPVEKNSFKDSFKRNSKKFDSADNILIQMQTDNKSSHDSFRSHKNSTHNYRSKSSFYKQKTSHRNTPIDNNHLSPKPQSPTLHNSPIQGGESVTLMIPNNSKTKNNMAAHHMSSIFIQMHKSQVSSDNVMLEMDGRMHSSRNSKYSINFTGVAETPQVALISPEINEEANYKQTLGKLLSKHLQPNVITQHHLEEDDDLVEQELSKIDTETNLNKSVEASVRQLSRYQAFQQSASMGARMNLNFPFQIQTTISAIHDRSPMQISIVEESRENRSLEQQRYEEESQYFEEQMDSVVMETSSGNNNN